MILLFFIYFLGDNFEADVSTKPKISNVNFRDANFFNLINDPSNKNYSMAKYISINLYIFKTNV